MDVEGVGNRIGCGHRVVVGEEFYRAATAGVIAVPTDVVDVFRILVGGERRVDHHVGWADVAVLHVALRWVDDLDEIVLRMDPLPGCGTGGAIHRPRPVVTGGPDRRGAVANVGDVAVDVGTHHVLLVVLMQTQGVVEFVDVARAIHAVKLFVEPGLVEIRGCADIRDSRIEVGFANHGTEMGKKGRFGDHATILHRDLEDLHLHRPPFAVVLIFGQRIQAKRHAVDIGRVRAAGGESPAHAVVVTDCQHRRANQVVAAGVQVACVDPRLVEHRQPLPGEVGVGEQDRATVC